ncbi:MAG TPA: HEAT repeat domain-containing protein [Planctomycetota bacterium]|nr:HEAT repeat domain-containing protein [Planctomycetota bacterium]
MSDRILPLILALALFPAAAHAGPGPAQDAAALIGELKEKRDEAGPEPVAQLAALRTREAMQGLVEAYERMASIYMRREIVRALARFDGVADAEQPALQKIADVATAAEERELRDAAIEALGSCKSLGKHFLQLIVESPADDVLRERAMELHVAMAAKPDMDWYQKLFDAPKEEGSQAKAARKKKDAEPEKKVVITSAIRELALDRLATTMDVAKLVDLAREKERDAGDVKKSGIRRIALLELASRGERKAKDVAEDVYKDVTELGGNRAAAAKVLAQIEGTKIASRFIEDGQGNEAVMPRELRYTLADLLAGMRDAATEKKLVRLVGKGKPYEKLFVLRAVRQVQDDKLWKAIAKLCADPDPEVRIAAAETLAARGDKEALDELQSLVDNAKEELVVTAALDAIAELRRDDPAWVAKLEQLAVGPKVEVRNAALLQLGRRGAQHVPLLAKALESEVWSTRYAALRGLEAARTREAVAAIVGRMEKETGLMLNRFAEALWRLSGQPHHTSTTAWKAWWAKEGAAFTPITAESLAQIEAGEEARRLKQTTQSSTFFGIRVISHRVIFILDVSGSMNELTRASFVGKEGEPRIDIAKRELANTVDALHQDSLFNLIIFSSDVERWIDGGIAQSAKATKDEAKAWVAKLGANGGTNLYGAMQEAFRDPDVDTIYVLSDGEPSVGLVTDPYQIREEVLRWNEHRGIVIHTIAVGGTLQILEWLAEDSGGTTVKYD